MLLSTAPLLFKGLRGYTTCRAAAPPFQGRTYFELDFDASVLYQVHYTSKRAG